MPARTLLACLATAVLVAIGLNVAAPSSSGQFIHSAQSLEKWWPPHPRNQVQLDNIGSTLQLAPGEGTFTGGDVLKQGSKHQFRDPEIVAGFLDSTSWKEKSKMHERNHVLFPEMNDGTSQN